MTKFWIGLILGLIVIISGFWLLIASTTVFLWSCGAVVTIVGIFIMVINLSVIVDWRN